MTFEDVKVDFLRADNILAKTILIRASVLPLLNKSVLVATPEDIIILKKVANRPVDRRDVAELKEVFKEKLDNEYIQHVLSEVKKAIS